MFGATHFVQECPICGRHLQIRLEFLGRFVQCPHCHGQFTATDPSNEPLDVSGSGEYLLQRADQLLESAGEFKPRPK